MPAGPGESWSLSTLFLSTHWPFGSLCSRPPLLPQCPSLCVLSLRWTQGAVSQLPMPPQVGHPPLVQSTKVRGWHCKVQPQLCWAPLPSIGDEVILRTGGLSQTSTPKWVCCRPDIRSSSTFCPPTLPHAPILALQDARRSLPTTQDIPFSFQ